MIGLSFEINGTNELVEIVEQIEKFAGRGELGSVYSRGAGPNRYEFDVMGHGRQKPIHQGRWQTDVSIAEDAKNAKRMTEGAGEALADIIKGGTGMSQLEAALEHLYQVTTHYPPPPAGSRYQRTFTLRDSFDKRLNR